MDSFIFCLWIPAVFILVVSVANSILGLSKKRIFLFYAGILAGVTTGKWTGEIIFGFFSGAALGAFLAEFATDEDFGTRQYKGGIVSFLMGGTAGGLTGVYTGNLFPFVSILLAIEFVSFLVGAIILWFLSDASTDDLKELDW